MAKRFSGYNPCEDKDWLYQKFVVEGKSREQIAEEIGCAASTVHVWLWKHRITTPKSFTVDQLRDLHVRQRKSVTEIAEIIGVSYDTIIYQLRVNGIPYTPNIGRNDRLAKYTREWLTDNYVNTRESISSLALKEGTSRSTLSEIIKAYGLPVKHTQETLPARLDNLLRMWTYRNLRPQILRKQQSCEQCGASELLELHHIVTIKTMVYDALAVTGMKLDTDEDIEEVFAWVRDNCPLFKDETNIQVLCHSCHTMEHARLSEAEPADQQEGSTTIETADTDR